MILSASSFLTIVLLNFGLPVRASSEAGQQARPVARVQAQPPLHRLSSLAAAFSPAPTAPTHQQQQPSGHNRKQNKDYQWRKRSTVRPKHSNRQSQKQQQQQQVLDETRVRLPTFDRNILRHLDGSRNGHIKRISIYEIRCLLQLFDVTLAEQAGLNATASVGSTSLAANKEERVVLLIPLIIIYWRHRNPHHHFVVPPPATSRESSATGDSADELLDEFYPNGGQREDAEFLRAILARFDEVAECADHQERQAPATNYFAMQRDDEAITLRCLRYLIQLQSPAGNEARHQCPSLFGGEKPRSERLAKHIRKWFLALHSFQARPKPTTERPQYVAYTTVARPLPSTVAQPAATTEPYGWPHYNGTTRRPAEPETQTQTRTYESTHLPTVAANQEATTAEPTTATPTAAAVAPTEAAASQAELADRAPRMQSGSSESTTTLATTTLCATTVTAPTTTTTTTTTTSNHEQLPNNRTEIFLSLVSSMLNDMDQIYHSALANSNNNNNSNSTTSSQ